MSFHPSTHPAVGGGKDGSPFGIAGIWENWKEPASGELIRTFAIITIDASELLADIHDRMPVILAPPDYTRWLGDEPDPRDLMRASRPTSCGCGRSRPGVKPENDDPSILEPIELAAMDDCAAPSAAVKPS